jgi:Holliday junction DNA helicase RuvA
VGELIGRLAGVLEEKSPDRVVLDVGGVGYELRVSLSTFALLPEAGTQARLFVHTHLREDALTLYGFATGAERFLFERLLSVSGVGPRIAIQLLSGLDPDQLRAAIRNGEVTALARVPGIGRKTAERIVVDLREKLDPDRRAGARQTGAAAGPGSEGAIEADVLSALINLGYPARDAERAVEAARAASRPARPGKPDTGDPPGFERLLREALRAAAAAR